MSREGDVMASRSSRIIRSPALASVSPACVLGIDIGLAGAIAGLDESGRLLWVEDMPALADGPAGRRSINAPLLSELVAKSGASQAFIEFVSARPGEGPTGAFAFGRCRGVAEGVPVALNVPARFLTAPQWKRCVGIAAGRAGAKDAARSEAIRRWPQHAAWFSRVKDADRAESALIAIAGLTVHQTTSRTGSSRRLHCTKGD
jgi:crossover junction endodeoxyribonuclease RuvC